MKDREYNAVRDFCKPLAQKWLPLMGCSWDKVHLQWSDHLFSVDQDGHVPECAAFCHADWRYMEATITFSCARLWDHFKEDGTPEDPEYIEEIVIHEIGHILLNEMRAYDEDRHPETVGHEERVVTRMARAFAYTWKQAFTAGLEARETIPSGSETICAKSETNGPSRETIRVCSETT